MPFGSTSVTAGQIADVIAGRADIPVKPVLLAQMIAGASPHELVGLRARLDIELSTGEAERLWSEAEQTAHLYRW